MKATKKIVGAACALVAAVALSAGSTFAWFTSNGEVTATGLQIDVNTSNAYLIIGESYEDLANNKKTITLAPTNNNAKLLPSAYEEDVSYEKDNAKLITTASNWYTGKGTAADNGDLVTSTKTALTAENFAQYVIEADIFVSAAEGSDDITTVNMTMTATPTWNSTAGTENDPISVVILYQTINDGGDAGNWNHHEANKENNHAITAVNLGGVTSAKYIQLHIMVYLDGNNAKVKSTNAKNLAGVTLSFSFTDPGQSA